MFKIQANKQYVQERIQHNSGDVQIKRYIKGRLLGKGGFAKCFQFTSEETNIKYAAKVIEKETLVKAKAKEKLQSQIQIHKSLSHKHVVKFQHFFQDHQYVYILLELCTNQTLNDLLKRRKRITEIEVKYYLLQIALALKYIHHHKVIHRDLKLGNLFLNDNLQVKLGDFGLATRISYQGERRKTICGTPNYIAPQILQNKKGHSYEVDIWSLGVIAYALLYGKPPFQTNDVNLTYSKIKSCNYVFLDYVKDVSPTAKAFVGRMLQVDPGKRATLQQILADPFLTRSEIPKHLPKSTMACPPNAIFLQQLKKQALQHQKESEKHNQHKLREFQSKQKHKEKSQIKPEAKTMSKIKSTDKISYSKNAKVERTCSLSELLSKKQFNSKGEGKKAPTRVRISVFQDDPRYGICYLLNNGGMGIRFNDATCMISNFKFTKFKYVTLSNNKQAFVQTFDGVSFPQNLKRKVKIINHFHKILKNTPKFQQQCKAQNDAKSFFSSSQNLSIYVSRHVSRLECHMFWFNNKNLHVIFKNNSQLFYSGDQILHIDQSKSETSFKNTHIPDQSQQIQLKVKFIAKTISQLKNIKHQIENQKHKHVNKQNENRIVSLTSRSSSKDILQTTHGLKRKLGSINK